MNTRPEPSQTSNAQARLHVTGGEQHTMLPGQFDHMRFPPFHTWTAGACLSEQLGEAALATPQLTLPVQLKSLCQRGSIGRVCCRTQGRARHAAMHVY